MTPDPGEYPPSATGPPSRNTHLAPVVATCSLLTGFPPFAGPWKLWKKDLLASVGTGKVSAEPWTLRNRNRLAAAGPGKAGIVGRDLPDALGLTRRAAGSVAGGQDLPGSESGAAGAGKGTAWMAAETGAGSKIPRTSRTTSDCGGEVVSVVAAAARLGSAWKTERRGSVKVMQKAMGQPTETAGDDACSS